MKYLTWIIFLALVSACVSDNSSEDFDSDKTEEDIYFEDYVSDPKKWGYINQEGQVIISAQFDAVRDFRNELAPVNKDGKWGMIDLTGRWVIPAEYQGIWPFQDGLARVKVFEKGYGFIDRSNVFKIAPTFEQVNDFSSGLARVKENGYYGFIDQKGDWRIPAKLQSAGNFIQDLAIFQNDDKFGLIHRNGNILVENNYERIVANETGDGYLLKKDGLYFHFDAASKKIGPHGYKRATHFVNSRAWVNEENDNWKLIDNLGNKISAIRAVQMLYAGNKRWIARVESGFTLLDRDGIILTDELYTQINKFYDNRAVFLKGNRWGYLDRNGNEIIPPTFLLIWDFKNKMARVADESGTYFIDTSGQPFLRTSYADIRDFHNNRARFQEL